MDRFGYIQTYDPLTGTGYIRPEAGGAMLPFNRSEIIRPDNSEISTGDRVQYRTASNQQGEQVAVEMYLA